MATNETIPMTTCEHLEQDLVLYYYGELAAPDRGKITAHVQTCAACSLYLKQLEDLLPSTRQLDEPPQAFWDDYSRELRLKIAQIRDKQPWSQTLASLFRSWAIPAFAGVAVVILAITLTLEKGFWSSRSSPPDDEAIMEVLPLTENLEFFKTMEVLDALDVLEEMGSSAAGAA
jgi:predicted anti-sigma-YlaC factor YlaD